MCQGNARVALGVIRRDLISPPTRGARHQQAELTRLALATDVALGIKDDFSTVVKLQRAGDCMAGW